MNSLDFLLDLEIRARKAALTTSKLSREAFDRNEELYKMELKIQNQDLIQADLNTQATLERYLNLYELAPIPYFTLKTNGLIADANKSALELIGVTNKKALVNKCFNRFLSPHSQHVFSKFKNESLSKKDSKLNCELRVLTKNNLELQAYVEGQWVKPSLSSEYEFLIFILDISHLKQKDNFTLTQQRQIAWFDKENSLNDVTSSLAHELNHPLAVIMNYIQGCIKRLEKGDCVQAELLEALQAAASQSDRAAEIILRMKNFHSYEKMQFENVPLDDLIKEIIEFLSYEIQIFPVAIYHYPSRAPNIRADKLHLRQALLNIIRNGLEAMQDDNTIEPRLVIEVNQSTKKTIEVNIMDNGPGLPPECFHKVFDPHYTTKAYGIGVGLSMSKIIINAHGGSVQVKQNASKGAWFKILLPIDLSS